MNAQATPTRPARDNLSAYQGLLHSYYDEEIFALMNMEQEKREAKCEANMIEKGPLQVDSKWRSDQHVADMVLKTEPTRQERRHVLFKLDLLLLPLTSGCVLLQMLDKTLLNYVNLMNFQKDANLSGQDYSWLGTIFYLGYLAGTPVHALFLHHLPLSTYVSTVIVVWGVVLACHAACNDFSSFMACRFFLGFFEGAINPGFVLLTGRFYRRQEQVIRVAVWYSMNGWAMVVGGLMTYGIIAHPSPYLLMWKEMFVAVGCATVGFGFFCILVMPSSPASTRYLTPRQRSVAVSRIVSNQSGIHDTHFKLSQLKESLLDIRLYLFFLAFGTVNVANGGISIFASQIITKFGFSTARSALLGMCQGAAEVVAVAIGTVLFVCFGRRDLPSIFGYIVAVIGGILMVAVSKEDKNTQMAGLSLAYFFPISYPIFYSWQSTAVSGTTKRIIFNASLQVAYCVGNAAGAQAYQSKDAAGGYVPGKITLIVMCGASAFFTACISLVHSHWNRQKETQYPHCDASSPAQIEVDLSDLTDKERPTYRYPN